MDKEDEKLDLSGDTLAVLQQFYTERAESEKRFEDLKTAAEEQRSECRFYMDMFSEDWNASQFWYSDTTATTLAKQLLADATAETNIAIVSAPSVFVQLKNMLAEKAASKQAVPHVSLLEYDERFSVFPDFVRYDFAKPMKLDPTLKGTYDRILCDPPFLSPDCQTKAAMTVRWLSRASSEEVASPALQIIVCTGERMEDLMHKLYSGVRTTTFEPRHAKDRLSNDFRCFANFECEAWSFRSVKA